MQTIANGTSAMKCKSSHSSTAFPAAGGRSCIRPNARLPPQRVTRYTSAAGNQIHLHARSPRSLLLAVNGLLSQILARIGECFQVPDGEQQPAPVVSDCEAKCTCVQPTSLLAITGQENEIGEIQDVSPTVETEFADGVYQPREEETARRTDTSCSPGVHPGSAQEILPVLQQIERNLEAIKQRIHLCPVENLPAAPPDGENNIDLAEGQPTTVYSLEKIVTPISTLRLTARSRGLPGFLRPNSQPAALAAVPAAVEHEDLTHGAVETAIGNEDDQTRGLIHEEIGRVLAAALGSLPQKRT